MSWHHNATAFCDSRKRAASHSCAARRCNAKPRRPLAQIGWADEATDHGLAPETTVVRSCRTCNYRLSRDWLRTRQVNAVLLSKPAQSYGPWHSGDASHIRRHFLGVLSRTLKRGFPCHINHIAQASAPPFGCFSNQATQRCRLRTQVWPLSPPNDMFRRGYLVDDLAVTRRERPRHVP